MAREKILVVDNDLHSLSKIYLTLIHRNFKAEACNNAEEIAARLKRLRPSVIILNDEEYLKINKKLKTPAIVMFLGERFQGHLNYGDMPLPKPVSAEMLIEAVERLV